MKILFYDTKSYDREFFEKLLPSYPGIEVKFIEANIHEETAALAHGYDAICAFVNADLGAPVIEELHRQGVKLILMRCAGYNNVDLETTAKCGIQVARVPGYSPEAVAEHAMALALTANRHTHKAYIKCRENNFALNGLMGVNFYQKTAGIIGTGKIGQAMAKICRGFGMKVIAYDLFPNKNLDFLEYVSLDELLSTSDLISLHCPMTPETEHLINSETIAKMKDGVILVNTSRGGLIKTDDLIAGIRDHKFFAVGLDVYEEESAYVYEDMSSSILPTSTIQRLLSFPNVTMTSHQGFFTVEALTNIAETTLENAKTFMDGAEMKKSGPLISLSPDMQKPPDTDRLSVSGGLFCSFDFNRSRQKTVRHRLCNKCALHPE
ncbi:MAG: 2-hydroxyacid dehydrogenase [Blautia massiliensis (ex Durand et al. 2017)]|uniref:2-hydroxyacid dehydrogenase n=1 Tax=Blautia massiliensis (ex Durand et al. 2017) TaxID=1737424 RepID=UPI00399D449C